MIQLLDRSYEEKKVFWEDQKNKKTSIKKSVDHYTVDEYVQYHSYSNASPIREEEGVIELKQINEKFSSLLKEQTLRSLIRTAASLKEKIDFPYTSNGLTILKENDFIELLLHKKAVEIAADEIMDEVTHMRRFDQPSASLSEVIEGLDLDENEILNLVDEIELEED